MMKLAFALLLSVAANGAVIQMESRQESAASSAFGSLTGALGFLSKQKALKVEEIKATSTTPGAKRIKLIYGPYVLRAANSTARVGNAISMDKGGTSYQSQVDSDFPSDVTVLTVHSELQDESFKRTDTKDGIYNHHNVFMDFSKPPPAAYACEVGKATGTANLPYSVFAAGATEEGVIVYASPKEDVKTGYYLGKNRKLTNMIDVVNYNNVQKTVYTATEIEYLPGQPAGYIDTVQQLVDPGTCGGQNGANIHPPKGVSKFSVNSTGIVVARDGYILNMRGHLHDGGVDLDLKVNGKVVCNSKAAYGGEGHVSKTADGKVWETISQTSTCDQPIKVSKGDKIYMQANYDLDLHPSREQGHSGMGGMKNVATVRAAMDGDDGAEQMALFVTYFAPTGTT